jgi:hypothetical protein
MSIANGFKNICFGLKITIKGADSQLGQSIRGSYEN